MPKNKRSPSRSYGYHLIRGMVAFVGVTMLSWAIWKLLDYYTIADSSFINAVVAGMVAVIILAIDHFRLREIE